MKALILNSGTGTRMWPETKSHPKCMTQLRGGETLLARQLRQLEGAGIREVIITTGPFEDALAAHARQSAPGLNITLVHNNEYAETNYIYSIYLARHLLEDDILLLHGDLVFDDEVLARQLAFGKSSMAVCENSPLPEKDFKAVVLDGWVRKVGVEFFENAVAAQPLYVLQKGDWLAWLREIEAFIGRGERKVYAENALNRVSEECAIVPCDVGGALCAEVDTPEDLAKVNEALREREEKG